MVDVFTFLLDGLPSPCKQTNLLTLGKSPRNDLHAASNKSGLSRLRLEQCRPEAFTISANDSSRRLILPSAKRKSLPISCCSASLTTGKRKHI